MRIRSLLLAPFLLAPALCKEPADEQKDALALALTSNNWSWESTLTGKKNFEEIQFYKGGIAENRQFFSCSWEITAPRTVLLQNTNNDRMNGKIAHLVFDADLKHYIGFDYNGKTIIEGFRREPLDPSRPAPPPREPGSK